MRLRASIRILPAIMALLLMAGSIKAEPQSPGLKGFVLEREGRSLALPLVESHGRPCLPLKEAALFAGAAITWQSSSKTLVLEHGGRGLRLALWQPWAYVGGRREPLPGGFTLEGGRPVLDVESLEALFKVMGLSGPQAPERLALRMRPARSAEMQPTPSATEEARIQVVEKAPSGEPRISTPSPTPERKRARRVIVLDPGHGGFDGGAVGRKGVLEKEACLDIGLRLRALLKKRLPGDRILMTRDRDVFIELKDRAQFANQQDADLFISIHANSSPNRKSHGTQVFFYDSQSSNRDAEVLARSENEDANYLDIMLTDLSKAQVRDESIALAMKVEGELVQSLGLKGRRLQYAPFWVLAKTKMPAVLVETAFISNPQEEALLKDPKWRAQVAAAVAKGVEAYLKDGPR